MVTILPKEESWYVEPAQKLATSLGEGYKTRHDTMALQNAISSLEPNASPRDILEAVAPIQTYNPNAKRQFTEDWFKATEMQQKFDEAKEKKAAEQAKLDREKLGASGLIDMSPLSEEDKQKFRESLESGELSPKLLEKQINAKIKKYEKERPYESALGMIDSMEELIKKGNLGRGSQYLRHINGEVAKDYGRYEQLGKALISFATTIVIRNRLEFETLAEKIYDPSISDKEKEGVLESMKQIIKANLSDVSGSAESDKNKQPTRPPFSAFEK